MLIITHVHIFVKPVDYYYVSIFYGLNGGPFLKYFYTRVPDVICEMRLRGYEVVAFASHNLYVVGTYSRTFCLWIFE